MKGADYIVDFLINKNITDVFGLPGGVVLDFLYAIDRRKDEINAHLNFHEQNSISSACGWAWISNNLGVAYATRGPGITNMVTGVTDAFCDSIPVLIITAHSASPPRKGMRVAYDQEIDVIQMFSGITKYAKRIDSINDLNFELEKACFEAMNGRKGPVILDIHSNVFSDEINITEEPKKKEDYNLDFKIKELNPLKKLINYSKRPVFLLGDGFRGSKATTDIIDFAEKNCIPILSSRFSQDLFQSSSVYFGYTASKGLRYSNWILSKSDLIIIIGNRMTFPIESVSFSRIINEIQKIRIEIDEHELERKFPKCINYKIDLKNFVPLIEALEPQKLDSRKWLSICHLIKSKLNKFDVAYPITAIAEILKNTNQSFSIISDVGNHEYWLCRALALNLSKNPTLFSKSFGSLGSSIGKSIGAFYGSLKPVVCFIGDQGLQMSIQELQFISKNKLPITIVLLNNFSSGMIRSREKVKYGKDFYPLHTTTDSGYSVPDFCSIANAYGINSYSFEETNYSKAIEVLLMDNYPKLIEFKIDSTIELIPFTPKNNEIKEMHPPIEDDLFLAIESL